MKTYTVEKQLVFDHTAWFKTWTYTNRADGLVDAVIECHINHLKDWEAIAGEGR